MPLSFGLALFAAGTLLFVAAVLICRHPDPPRWSERDTLQSTLTVMSVGLWLAGLGLTLRAALSPAGMLANPADAMLALAIAAGLVFALMWVRPDRRLRGYAVGRMPAGSTVPPAETGPVPPAPAAS